MLCKYLLLVFGFQWPDSSLRAHPPVVPISPCPRRKRYWKIPRRQSVSIASVALQSYFQGMISVTEARRAVGGVMKMGQLLSLAAVLLTAGCQLRVEDAKALASTAQAERNGSRSGHKRSRSHARANGPCLIPFA